MDTHLLFNDGDYVLGKMPTPGLLDQILAGEKIHFFGERIEIEIERVLPDDDVSLCVRIAQAYFDRWGTTKLPAAYFFHQGPTFLRAEDDQQTSHGYILAQGRYHFTDYTAVLSTLPKNWGFGARLTICHPDHRPEGPPELDHTVKISDLFKRELVHS